MDNIKDLDQMNALERKCKTCKYNYQPTDCEPRCNQMCATGECFEAITNYDFIMRMGEEDLANVLFNWFCNGYDEVYIKDFNLVYDDILSWLQQPAWR